MKVLFLDTSCRLAKVFLIGDGKLLSEASDDGVRTHASMLFPCIGDALRAASMKPGDVDVFSVTAGPGSYTGLRVAMSAAKTLSYSLDKPLVPVNTLRYLASSVSGPADVKVSLIDGRNTLCYYLMTPGMTPDSAFSAADDSPEELDPRDTQGLFNTVGSDYLENICGVIKKHFCGRSVVFTGDGALNYRALVSELLPEALFAPDDEMTGTFQAAWSETTGILCGADDVSKLDALNAAVDYYKDVHVTAPGYRNGNLWAENGRRL